MDYSRISESLNNETIKVSVVSLGGVNAYDVTAGMTVSAFKAKYGLEGTKIVNENGDTLDNSTVLSRNMQVFVSTPKKNG